MDVGMWFIPTTFFSIECHPSTYVGVWPLEVEVLTLVTLELPVRPCGVMFATTFSFLQQNYPSKGIPVQEYGCVDVSQPPKYPLKWLF